MYQAMNASIAIAAMEYLLLEGERAAGDTDRESYYSRWRAALSAVTWECRMEEVLPGVFIDGAHNPGAVEAFVESVRAVETAACPKSEKGELPVILFSAVEDKEYEQMIAYLCRHLKVKTFVVTEVEDRRKVPADKLGRIFRKYTEESVLVRADRKEAFPGGVKPEGTLVGRCTAWGRFIWREQ